MAEQKQPLADYLHGSVDAVLKPILKELASMATRPQSEVAIRQFIIDRAATQQDERLMQMVQDTVAQMAASNAALGFEQKKVTLASGETVGYLEKPAKNAGGRTLVSLHGLSANADFQLFGCGHWFTARVVLYAG